MSQNVVITGVSKGIGYETTKLFLEEGYNVIGWGRTAPEIEHDNLTYLKVDVTKINDVVKAAQSTREIVGSIDILINNAGIGFEGEFHEMDPDNWKSMFDTNVHGLFYCSQEAAKDMIAQRKGHIVNISSIAGITGIAGMAGYCGTKFAVRGISHSMFKELRNYGIKVTCIYPGSTKTNFFDRIDSVDVNDQMMDPADIALTILQCVETSGNYLPVDIEIRPLNPKR